MKSVKSACLCLSPLVCALVLAGCMGGGGDASERDSSVKGVSVKPLRSDRDAGEAFRLVNDERSRRGMRTLVRRQDLDAVALAHARDLMRMNRLSHTSSDGGMLEQRLAHLEWESAGENLARNKGYDEPATEAVRGWIASRRHYDNMFNPQYSQAGMAALYDPDSGFTYFVQVFVVPV